MSKETKAESRPNLQFSEKKFSIEKCKDNLKPMFSFNWLSQLFNNYHCEHDLMRLQSIIIFLLQSFEFN